MAGAWQAEPDLGPGIETEATILRQATYVANAHSYESTRGALWTI